MRDSDALPLVWALVNDSYYTDLALHHPPHLITIACMYVAAGVKAISIIDWLVELNIDSVSCSFY